MSFYDEISALYDDIFPLSLEQVDFVRKHLDMFDCPTILDVGCANGKLLMELSEEVKNGFGIDLDQGMIDKSLRENKAENLLFLHMNMLHVGERFTENSFDIITCFGNTLVHLKANEIEEFMKQVQRLLKDSGVLLLQLINYEYIFSNQIHNLPMIENDKIRFERIYDWDAPDVIRFKTVLENKVTTGKVENQISLYPITKETLGKMLKNCGFTDIACYKDYSGNSFGGSHYPLIISAKK